MLEQYANMFILILLAYLIPWRNQHSIRLEEDIKNDMDAVCESLGMSMSAAFNVFARAFVRNRGFPFDVKLQEQKDP